MGRFDALTKLDEKPQDLKSPVAPSPTFPSQSEQPNKEQKKPANPQTRKTASPLDRKPANPLFELDSLEKPEKYTTRLLPSLIKKVRIHAIDKEMKDYEVVSTTLNQYFERNK